MLVLELVRKNEFTVLIMSVDAAIYYTIKILSADDLNKLGSKSVDYCRLE